MALRTLPQNVWQWLGPLKTETPTGARLVGVCVELQINLLLRHQTFGAQQTHMSGRVHQFIGDTSGVRIFFA